MTKLHSPSRVSPMSATLEPDGGQPAPSGTALPESDTDTCESSPWIEGMDATLERGKVVEELGRIDEAMSLHDRVPGLPPEGRSPFEEGRVLHRMGTRAAGSSNWSRAFAAHLLAARKASDLSMVKACGTSLASAGLSSLALPSDGSIRGIVGEELAGTAFRGIVEQAREVLLGGGTPTFVDALRVHGRLAHLVMLSAFAELEAAPMHASKTLYHEVVIPFLARHAAHEGRPIVEAQVVTFVFKKLARVLADVAEQGRQVREGVPATEEAAKSLIESTARAFVGPNQRTMLRWLGSYLRDDRGAAWATDERIDALTAALRLDAREHARPDASPSSTPTDDPDRQVPVMGDDGGGIGSGADGAAPAPCASTRVRMSYDVDSWDEVGIDEEARTCFLRGLGLEEAGDAERALACYERGLATSDDRRRPEDTAALLHHEGSCASVLGDARRAWNAYLDAARTILDDDVGGRVSGSLSEAGLLRVTHPSALPTHAEVDEDLVSRAFDDAVEGARRRLLEGGTPTYDDATPPHRAFTGVMVLAAHAGSDVELLRASETLFRAVARPFVDRHGVRRRDPEDETFRIAVAFEALARLCAAVAERERGRRKGRDLTRSELVSLAHHLGEAFVGESLDLMADWLGTYLRGRHGADWVTDALVWMAANP